MRILLINPPIRIWSQPNCFPQGLGYIAQVLRKDHNVSIWDMNADRRDWHKIFKTVDQCFTWPETEEISEHLKDIDAVGITGLITNYVMVKGLISFIKGFDPEIPIVVGGPLGTSIPEIMLRKAGADICVIGEGEFTAQELFRELDLCCHWSNVKESEVRGIAYLYDGWYSYNGNREAIKNINILPLPAYDLFPTEVYAKNPVGSSINKAKWIDGRAERPSRMEWELSTIKGEQTVPKSMNILSSRGCAWRCVL
ncbi:MAG: cobalamin-dependent protein, partial [Pseudomonadota bacterium]